MIYTRDGDKGFTKIGDRCIPKHKHPVTEDLANIDRLQAEIGMLKAHVADIAYCERQTEILDRLLMLQKFMQKICSEIANTAQHRVNADDVGLLEQWIDDTFIVQVREFYVPGNSLAANASNVARTTCRLVETQLNNVSNQNLSAFINRLSDYLFALTIFLDNIEQSDGQH